MASCNFKTGNYIDQLSIPNSIRRIDIKVNKDKVKSVMRSLTWRQQNYSVRIDNWKKRWCMVCYE